MERRGCEPVKIKTNEPRYKIGDKEFGVEPELHLENRCVLGWERAGKSGGE